MRKIARGWGEAGRGSDWKIMCSLEGGYSFERYYFWHLKGVLT